MKKKHQSGLLNRLAVAIAAQPRFALMLMRRGQFVRDTFADLGLDLIDDFLYEHRRQPFDRGKYAVLQYIPSSRQALPDWGTLTVRGPGSWVLRSRDGQTVWAAGRRGLPVCLRAEGGGNV